MTNYSKVGNNFAPKHCSSFVLLEFDNYDRWNNLSEKDYKILKEKTQNYILDKFESITGIPIRKKADVIFSATPKTFQHYMSNLKGEIYGPAATIEQSLTRRTSPETPIKNLSLVGGYTQPCAGISAVFDTGVITANDILKKI